jgi:hypothetical protein
MQNLTLVILLLTAVAIACSSTPDNSFTLGSNSTSGSSAGNQAAPPAPSFDADLAGQVKRIISEGTDDAAVRKNIADADRSVTYEHLKKNAARYAGRPWTFTGKILEISEVGGNTVARIALDDWGNKAIYVAGPFTTEFVEKNRVQVIGYLAGDYSYTSQANWNITIPAVAARAMVEPNKTGKSKK